MNMTSRNQDPIHASLALSSLLSFWYKPNSLNNKSIHNTLLLKFYICAKLRLTHWYPCPKKVPLLLHRGVQAVTATVVDHHTSNYEWKFINHRGSSYVMMTSSNENIFRVTGHLCGEFTGHRWISHTKASDAELWILLWSAPEYTVE